MAGTPRYEGGGYENYGREEGQTAGMGSEFQETAQKVGGRMQDVKESVSEMGGRAKDVAQQQVESLRQFGAQTAQRLEDQIQNDPIKACLIAAGAGLGLGFLLGAMWAGRD